MLGFLRVCRCQGVLHACQVCVGVEASCVHVCVEGARIESAARHPACAWCQTTRGQGIDGCRGTGVGVEGMCMSVVGVGEDMHAGQ